MSEKFYAWDFDRTLGLTELLAVEFTKHVAETDPATAEILRATKEAVEKSKGSFDMLGAIREHMGELALRNYVDGFVGRQHEVSFLEEGAEVLLHDVAEGGHRSGIITRGGVEWQKIKLRKTGLEGVPHLILGKEDDIKGKLIASWYDSTTGLYRLPDELGGGFVEEVVLVEDKETEFDGFPTQASARGYLFTGSDIKPETEVSTKPLSPNIVRVNSLHEIARHEGLNASS